LNHISEAIPHTLLLKEALLQHYRQVFFQQGYIHPLALIISPQSSLEGVKASGRYLPEIM